ncbi:RidA family protein [Streptomyces coeruleorubidus]|uniref:RidA family protein n=1 Tax=Streptomyces coeruleorubidus TaxID=116188 RepID=UPI003CD03F28
MRLRQRTPTRLPIGFRPCGWPFPSSGEPVLRALPDGGLQHLHFGPAALPGRLAAGQGTVGRDIDLETARSCAHDAVLNCLAAAVQAVGDLDRVRIVQMLVLVASTPDFGEQSQVANAASELLIEVLGENGRHARTAIGVAGLPLNSPVEIQMVITAA